MKTLINLILLWLACQSTFAQGRYVGSIVDSLGTPIPHVSIRLESTKTPYQSDDHGFFNIPAQTNTAPAKISRIEYMTQEVVLELNKRNKVYVMQRANHILEEVQIINTGYQTLNKERSTGSFSVIDSTKLETRISTNVLEKLEYLAPGLQFDNRNGKPNINIRGINSFTDQLTQPLIIVDNFPYAGDIANINPNDVESVTLLKDASAASIWGARAGNGVIVINLKKNSKGTKRLEYSSNFVFGGKPDLFYLQNISSSDFIDVEKMLYEQGFYNNALNSARKKRFIFSPVVSLLDKQTKGLISYEEAEAKITSFRQQDYRNDMLKYMFRPSFDQQHHIGYNFGSKGFSNRTAVGFDKKLETQSTNNSYRISLQSSNNIKISDKLQLQNSIQWSSNNRSSSPANLNYPIMPQGGKAVLYPYAQLETATGEALAIPYMYDLDYVQGLENTALLDWTFKPIEDFKKSHANNRTNGLGLNASITYKPFPYLKIEGLYNHENQQNEFKSLYGEESFYARNLINRFTQINNDIVTRIIPIGGVMRSSHQRMRANKARLQMSFDYDLLDDWMINLFAGAEISDLKSESQTNTFYGYDEKLLSSILVDPVNSYPIYDGLASNAKIPSSEGFGRLTTRFVSVFSNGAVSYKNKYFINFSLRRDASNNFGVQTNQRWKPLWSSGLAWSLNQEPFLKSQQWLNLLKLRATLGHSGNIGGASTTLPTIYYQDRSGYGLSNWRRANVNALPNPYLKWEDVRMVNLGLDFALLKNNLSGSVEFYQKKSTDLLANDPLDYTYGISTIMRNVGEAIGKGVDINLMGKYHITNQLRMSTELLFSYNTDRVTKFNGTNAGAQYYLAGKGGSLMPLEGYSLYPVFSYRFEGLDPQTGDPQGWLKGAVSKDYPNLLNVSTDELIYHGNGLPKYYGSFRPTFFWKGLQASINLTYKMNYYFLKETIRYSALFSSWAGHADYVLRWQNPGDEKWTTVPSLQYPANANRDDFYAYSSSNILKGDHIRISDLRIAYTLKPVIANRSTKLTIAAYANNLGIIWRKNKANIDPDYFGIPPVKTYGINMNLNF
ncbi:SusC/RagA family TonB-linked outer membrane protein [Sphingobacterium sp. N143]|uniref:SusC/RagA family TonB-linked outer membrane protein n=1 Tax=Sphingobacterium sp. N143 TaxID=2746727 RepID=UPI002576F459|nr:SusC/RagA family TonB-linked outer membrane protein [Sphingobacterium sp. N143]MDM1296818.1 SusC/RagA family TonB-linked outer membrane protein [Sphingobacterium sp. N143]